MSSGKTTRRWLLGSAGVLGTLAAGARIKTARAQGETEDVLKIGVLGVLRGPAASWGLVNKHCAEVTAAMYNERGGVDIGGRRYKVDVTVTDDQLDPKLAVAGAQAMLENGIRYIIGPNIDTTAAVIVRLLRAGNAVNIAYGFARYLYTPPQRNSILGMIASYQDAPRIYDHLKTSKGVRTVSFIARNEADSLNQRDEGVRGAYGVGLTINSASVTYPYGVTDFRRFMAQMLRGGSQDALAGVRGQTYLGPPTRPSGDMPDLVVLSGVAPGDAPLALIALRELGYKGLVSTETAQDARALAQAGPAADGFICVGGASPADSRSPYMDEFVRRYVERAGGWDDEAGTKVYALEMILRTLQMAGPAAIDDATKFLDAVPTFAIDNPFLKEKKTLRYMGQGSFGQPRQIGVPLVIEEFRDGAFKPLFVGAAE
ncbi:MAG: ABC transporter substrate-binding protein [Acetobacteraceae bacterium]|nr:ABC transporter substrate-binding protein [Acetobacteraceae bacterium]